MPSDGLDFSRFDVVCGQDCDCCCSQGVVCQIRDDSSSFCHLSQHIFQGVVPEWSLLVPDVVGYGIELRRVEIFWPLEKHF